MNDATSPFVDNPTFRHAFESGLEAQLARDGLGTFILATANASFESATWQRMRNAIAERFSEYRDHYQKKLIHSEPIGDSDEDFLVFLKLHLLGLENIEPTRFQQAGPWELQYNRLRGFRPMRMSAEIVDRLQRPFNPDGFHFNKPFMEKEIFWEGELCGKEAALYFNKYPFVTLHGLLVPERHQQHSQFLHEAMHHYIWQVTAELGKRLNGVGFGYNSYGAYSSVNHLHVQMFVRETPLPVSLPQFRHNGGASPYPVLAGLYESAESAWQELDRLHKTNTPYNLLYLPGVVFVLPRRPQGSVSLPDWSVGMAWYEMAGGFLLTDPQQLDLLTADAITTTLRRFDV